MTDGKKLFTTVCETLDKTARENGLNPSVKEIERTAAIVISGIAKAAGRSDLAAACVDFAKTWK